MSKPAADTAAHIAERIWLAIAERRLRPGSRLKEEELAEIFAVSRARIRQALALLEREGLAKSQPNRGAFVSAPDIHEAMDVLYARRAIEARVIQRLIAVVTDADIARLRSHVAQEQQAAARGDVPAIIRLSGGFHLLLAEILGSDFLHATLRDLISRSSLITAVYRSEDRHNCGPDDHLSIIAALEARDTDRALSRMSRHLDQIEAELDLSGKRQMPTDLRGALG